MKQINSHLYPKDIAHITSYLDISTALPQQADLIFTFGTRFDTPATIAASFYHQGVAPYICVTGGNNRHTGVNEAQAHHKILLDADVPNERIIVEDKSNNTMENVTFALPLIDRVIGLDAVKSVLAVAKWQHSRRAIMTLKRHMPANIRYYVHTYEQPHVQRDSWHLTEEGRAWVLKNWHGIPKYLKLDHIAEIDYDEGMKAYC